MLARQLQPTRMGPAVAWCRLQSRKKGKIHKNTHNAAPLKGSLKTHGSHSGPRLQLKPINQDSVVQQCYVFTLESIYFTYEA